MSGSINLRRYWLQFIRSLLFCSAVTGIASGATNTVTFTLQDLLSQGYTNRVLSLTPKYPPIIDAGRIVVAGARKGTSDVSGVIVFTNVSPGTYIATVEGDTKGNPATIWTNTIPTNQGALNGWEYVSTLSTNASLVAYSQTAADARFVSVAGTNTLLTTNGGRVALNVTISGGTSGTNFGQLVVSNAPILLTNVVRLTELSNASNALLNVAIASSNGAVAYASNLSGTLSNAVISSIGTSNAAVTNFVGGNFVKSLYGYAYGLTAVTFTATNELIIRANPGWSIYNPNGDNSTQFVEASSPNLGIEPYFGGFRSFKVLGSPITAAGPNQGYEYGHIVSGTNGAFGSVIYDGVSTYYGGGNLGTTSGFHWGNLYLSGDAYWQDGGGPRWLSTGGGNVTNMFSTNATFLGANTWTSTTNDGGAGTAILTNFGLVTITNALNTNRPGLSVRVPPSQGTNIANMLAVRGTTNMAFVSGDGAIYGSKIWLNTGGVQWYLTNVQSGAGLDYNRLAVRLSDGTYGAMAMNTISFVTTGGNVVSGQVFDGGSGFTIRGLFSGNNGTVISWLTNNSVQISTNVWTLGGLAGQIRSTNNALAINTVQTNSGFGLDISRKALVIADVVLTAGGRAEAWASNSVAGWHRVGVRDTTGTNSMNFMVGSSTHFYITNIANASVERVTIQEY